MKIISNLLVIIIISAVLSSCTGSKADPVKISDADPLEIFKNGEHIIELGGADYTSEELDSSFLTGIKENEDYFIYDANNRYLVYSITMIDSSDSYQLTKNLNLYDFRKGTIIKSIPFEEPAYVGDAIIKGDSLFYNRIPIADITETSASWEVHESYGESDVIRATGISSYCDNYPQFAILNNKILFSYEDRSDGNKFTFGCKIIDGGSVKTLFSYNLNNNENQRTSFLGSGIDSNGKSASMFLYENDILHHLFFDEKGIKSKTPFQDLMYQGGMMKGGLILSQVINQDMKNQYYQVSVISDTGKADSFPDRNCSSYFRFTSGPANHSMAVTDDSLYFFEYESGVLKRTKITIPGAKLSNVMPFNIGNNDYLIEDFSDRGKEKLFIVHVK